MENMIMARDVFRRDYFESYSEFYLAMAIGNMLSKRGYVLNMDYMRVDADAVPESMLKYYKKLLYEGAIVISMYDRDSANPSDFRDVDVDTSYFDKVQLTKPEGGKLLWSMDIARENYGNYYSQFIDILSLGDRLIHLVAYHIVNHILDGEKRKLVISFDNHKARTTFLYVNIYNILHTMAWLNELVELDVDFGDYVVDLDYSIFCNSGRVAGRYKFYTVQEKVKLLSKYGMVEGAILVLWEREGMCENNEYGHIKKARVFRLDEIGDTFIGVTFMSLNKTKEELRQDYNDIDESTRYLFVDMLDKPPHTESEELDIYGLGINNHFFREDKFITLVDKSEKVFKTVTIDDKVVTVEMSAIDAFYWLLKQYDMEFDAELYKSMYYDEGVEPLWDMYH